MWVGVRVCVCGHAQDPENAIFVCVSVRCTVLCMTKVC